MPDPWIPGTVNGVAGDKLTDTVAKLVAADTAQTLGWLWFHVEPEQAPGDYAWGVPI